MLKYYKYAYILLLLGFGLILANMFTLTLIDINIDLRIIGFLISTVMLFISALILKGKKKFNRYCIIILFTGFILLLYGILQRESLIISLSLAIIAIGFLFTFYVVGIKKDTTLLTMDLGETYRKFSSIILLIAAIFLFILAIKVNFCDINNLKFINILRMIK